MPDRLDVPKMESPVDDRWYKDAIVYAVDVGTFQDSDGDGFGDFAGLRSRLDYLTDLGVTCLWLLPFYPTPDRDNGYDVSDFLGVDPRHGTPDDFAAFRREAAALGIRLILDLVVHHTSDEHPWFQAARADPASPYRDYHVWTDRPPAESSAKLIFPGVEESVWAYDEVAAAYYLHQFYRFQPDINVEYPALQEEARRIVHWWRDRGADGFRVDAASHLLGTQVFETPPSTQPHRFLRHLRAALDEHRPGGALLAEADVSPDDLAAYFGDGDQMHLLLNFLLDNYLFLGFARQEAEPIARGLGLLPAKPDLAQWANFLRNLDELDLEQLSEDEREEVYRSFAPEERMRAYGKGIRRRLAPMLGGDPRRVGLAFSLLLSLPGTPLIAYGDEFGMGDDLSLPERRSVRTVMQWSRETNGGFSTAPREALCAPAMSRGDFGYERVNVADQRRDPDSLFNRVRRAIAVRKQHPVFGRGSCRVISTDQRSVLAHRGEWAGQAVVALHNLANDPCDADLELAGVDGTHLVEILADRAYDPPDRAGRRIALGGFGYRWFRVESGGSSEGRPARSRQGSGVAAGAARG